MDIKSGARTQCGSEFARLKAKERTPNGDFRHPPVQRVSGSSVA